MYLYKTRYTTKLKERNPNETKQNGAVRAVVFRHLRVDLNEGCVLFFFSIFPKLRYFLFFSYKKIPKFRENRKKQKKNSSLRVDLSDTYCISFFPEISAYHQIQRVLNLIEYR